MNQQLCLLKHEHIQEPQLDTHLAFLTQFGHADFLLSFQCFAPARELVGVIVVIRGSLHLLLQLANDVCVVAVHACDLTFRMVASLAMTHDRQRRHRKQSLLAWQRICQREAQVPCFQLRQNRRLGQPGVIRQRIEMTDLPAEVQIERDGHNLLFFLIADERALQPEDGLRKVQGTEMGPFKFGILVWFKSS